MICQRLMVQGLPGTKTCNGPFDVVKKVTRAEGLRGLYRGFGLTAITQTPASALWWGAYGSAQHIIWSLYDCRSLGYSDNMETKPNHVELVTVQAAAGLVAGACSSVLTTPIDTVKMRLPVIDDNGVGRPFWEPNHTMVYVRQTIVADASSALSRAVCIATRYSAVCRQFGSQNGGPGTQVIDYKTQQSRLFPLLASAYAFSKIASQ